MAQCNCCSCYAAGDVDLYCSNTITRPRVEESTWLSAGIGSDRIVLTTDLLDWDKQGHVLYIGAHTLCAPAVAVCALRRTVLAHTLAVDARCAVQAFTAGTHHRTS